MSRKITIALALVLAFAFLMAGCGGKTTAPEATKAPVVAAATKAPETAGTTGGATTSDTGFQSNLPEAVAELPALITSAGQSADLEMVKVMFMNSGMDYKDNSLATTADFEGCPTLVVAIGGSSKGLGAAGIDADQELARVTALLDEAKKAGMYIIAMHIGGTARRGQLGDRYIEPVLSYADYAIVVAAGDEDGKFSNYCSANNIPLDTVNAMTEVTPVIAAAFKK